MAKQKTASARIMNTKTIALLSVPLVALLVFWGFQNGLSEDTRALTSKTHASATSRSSSESLTPQPKSTSKPPPIHETKEFREKKAALLAKMASLTNEKDVDERLDAMMSRREPEYGRLFRTWGLTQSVANSVRQMIREREKEQLLWIKKPEASSVETSTMSFQEKTAVGFLWDSQIVDMLGKSRFDELKKVEAADNSTMLSKAAQAGALPD
jgi:hypothetical protein